MSEQTDALDPEGIEAAESAETAQGAIDTEVPSHPWGDDFDADKAWRALTNARESEKEAKERLRQERAIWDDEQAVSERVRERFRWEVSADEDDAETDFEDDNDFEDPQDAKFTQLEQRVAAAEDREFMQAFNAHLDHLQGEADVKLTKRERQWVEALCRGANRDADVTVKAFADVVEDRKQMRAAWEEELKASKKTSRPPGSGKTATQVPDLDNDQERRAWMAERLRALNES